MDARTAPILEELTTAAAKIGRGTKDRDRLILEALDEGVPVELVAFAAGLSPRRIYQMKSAGQQPRPYLVLDREGDEG